MLTDHKKENHKIKNMQTTFKLPGAATAIANGRSRKAPGDIVFIILKQLFNDSSPAFILYTSKTYKLLLNFQKTIHILSILLVLYIHQLFRRPNHA